MFRLRLYGKLKIWYIYITNSQLRFYTVIYIYIYIYTITSQIVQIKNPLHSKVIWNPSVLRRRATRRLLSFEGDGQKPKSWAWALTVAFPARGCGVSPSIQPQAVGRQVSTSCPSASCYSGTLLRALCGESEGEMERRKRRRKKWEGPLWGCRSPPLITVLTASLRLNNNRGSSPVASLYAYYVYRTEYYGGRATCVRRSQPAHVTNGMQRPFLVIQALQQLHKNESQPRNRSYYARKRVWLWQTYIGMDRDGLTRGIWCASIGKFCERNDGRC